MGNQQIIARVEALDTGDFTSFGNGFSAILQDWAEVSHIEGVCPDEASIERGSGLITIKAEAEFSFADGGTATANVWVVLRNDEALSLSAINLIRQLQPA